MGSQRCARAEMHERNPCGRAIRGWHIYIYICASCSLRIGDCVRHARKQPKANGGGSRLLETGARLPKAPPRGHDRLRAGRRVVTPCVHGRRSPRPPRPLPSGSLATCASTPAAGHSPARPPPASGPRRLSLAPPRRPRAARATRGRRCRRCRPTGTSARAPQ